MGELPEAYFALTPRLVTAVVDGRSRQRQTDFEQLAWAIHQNAALCLSDPRKFPAFDKFIKPMTTKASGRTSPERMLSIAQMWTAVVNRGVADEG